MNAAWCQFYKDKVEGLSSSRGAKNDGVTDFSNLPQGTNLFVGKHLNDDRPNVFLVAFILL